MSDKILTVCRPDIHSETGASGAERWMNCPGSVALSRGLKSTDSIPAMEGTAAHKLGEMVLKEEITFEKAHGRVIQVEGNGRLYDFVVDDEMCEAVKVYTDYVHSGEYPKAVYVVETSVELDMIPEGSSLELFGKVDVGIYEPGVLKVVDYKHGKGIPVYAENNIQGMFYGFGMLQQKTEFVIPEIEQVELVIVQPRHKGKNLPIDSWTISAAALKKWGREGLIPAALRTEEKDAPLKTGKWCRFCKAKGFCPKIKEEDRLDLEFTVARYGGPVSEGVQKFRDEVDEKSLSDLLTAEVSVLPPLDVSSALGRIKTLRGQMKTAEKMMAEFEEKALKRLTDKKDIPGYIVGNAASSRTWKDEKSTAVILDLLIPEKDYRQSGLKTVAQIEKLLDEGGHKAEEILKNEIESIVGKPKLTAAVKDKDIFKEYIIDKPKE